jgi:hypothetical protein
LVKRPRRSHNWLRRSRTVKNSPSGSILNHSMVHLSPECGQNHDTNS